MEFEFPHPSEDGLFPFAINSDLRGSALLLGRTN